MVRKTVRKVIQLSFLVFFLLMFLHMYLTRNRLEVKTETAFSDDVKQGDTRRLMENTDEQPDVRTMQNTDEQLGIRTMQNTNEQLGVRTMEYVDEQADVRTRFVQDPNTIYQIITYGVPRPVTQPDGTFKADFSPYGQDQMARFKRCRYNNCNFTLSHTQADVVVVEAMSYDWNIYRPRLLPLEGQLWILQTWEPPHVMHTFGAWHRMERQFHLTATYQTTSDIHCPYGITEEKPGHLKGQSRAPGLIAKKDRLVAWIVSNCGGQSERLRYARELRKHISVDIYGKCGNLTCSKFSSTCHEMIVEHYKFYLSFENSICFDYYTEKAMVWLGKLVPIVLGGANYSDFMPPHSYINVRDFRSAKALAEYLLKLDKQPELYAEYFAWTYNYTAQYAKPEILWPCRVCEYLNTHTITQQQLRSPKVSLQSLTNKTYACIPPDEYYKDILYE